MSRTASLDRETKESKVHVTVDLDGRGRSDVSTGVGFFDHMLGSFARHSLVDLSVTTDGDTHIDAHHTVEDTAIPARLRDPRLPRPDRPAREGAVGPRPSPPGGGPVQGLRPRVPRRGGDRPSRDRGALHQGIPLTRALPMVELL